MFKGGIRSAIDTHNLNRMTNRKPDVPWITVVLNQICNRDVLLRITKHSKEKSSHEWEVYRRYRNIGFKKYSQPALEWNSGRSLKSNPKKFWSCQTLSLGSHRCSNSTIEQCNLYPQKLRQSSWATTFKVCSQWTMVVLQTSAIPLPSLFPTPVLLFP